MSDKKEKALHVGKKIQILKNKIKELDSKDSEAQDCLFWIADILRILEEKIAKLEAEECGCNGCDVRFMDTPLGG